MTPFEEAIAAVLLSLQPGDVVTYGEVALEAGRPGASRAVGAFLAGSEGAYPWWRVVNAAGRLVPGHEAEQLRRLRADGVEVGEKRGRVTPARFGGETPSVDGRGQNPTRRPQRADRFSVMSIYDHQLSRLDGSTLDLHDYEAQALLIVNVASKCGLTPQYGGLEKLHEQYAGQGFTVLGVPCNQFGEQEPGSPDEIATFCSTTYGVTFPMAEKVEVNGDGRHPLYQDLTAVADAEGRDGDIQWNFEKFLVAPGGKVTRFGPMVTPEDDALVAAVQAALPGA